MKKWEINFTTDPAEVRRLLEEGWEPYTIYPFTGHTYWHFKRPMEEEDKA